MMGADIVVIALIALIIGGAVVYIIRAKRRGVRCIGCPMAGKCQGHCGGQRPDQDENNP